MKRDEAAGGVVFLFENNQPRILLILDRYGYWTLPKGHLDKGETNEAAALREIAEETGVQGQIRAPLTTISYQVTRKGERRDKVVVWYLVEASNNSVTLPGDGEVEEIAWCAPEEALARIGYDQVRAVLAQALPMIAALSDRQQATGNRQ